MNPERWQQIERLYHSALEQDPARLDGFLAEACQDDADLHREVESLLAQSRSTGALVDQGVWAAAGAFATAQTALKPGETLGPYEILGLLGAGGMGEVYLAEDTRLVRKVAIRISHERLYFPPIALGMLKRIRSCVQSEIEDFYPRFPSGKCLALQAADPKLPSIFVYNSLGNLLFARS
jgi:serine/threonine protein kinase